MADERRMTLPHRDPNESIELPHRERQVAVLLGLLALLLAGLVVTRYWSPAPPKVVVMSTGPTDGAYHAFGLRYQQVLARSGVKLVLLPSAGAVENLERLRRGRDGVSVALVQGGVAQADEYHGVNSLGGMFLEPLWVFYRVDSALDDIAELGGRRVAVGVSGSGTQRVAEELLRQVVSQDVAPVPLPIGGTAAVEALRSGDVDAAMFVAAPEAPAVQALLRAPGIRLLSFRRAEGYARRFPYLTRLVLPEGAVDMVRNIPGADTAMVAVTASLLAREDLHPVIVDLLLGAAREAHSRGSLLWRAGDFPSSEAPEFALSPDAERFYKNGPSALNRYLPFWAGVWIQRLIFVGLPILVIAVPLLRYLPVLYRWGMRRRIYRWYGELAFIERALGQGSDDVELQGRRLDGIEAQINRMRIPAAFASEAYTLKMHLQMVRKLLHDEPPAAAPGAASPGGLPEGT